MLSQRSAVILKSIVEHYIDRASPVPSQSIIHSHGLEVSSATIRNEMARLEQEGYIIRPHTSAGSVPSDKGYRFYVETLHNVHLPAHQQRMVAHLFHQVETRVEEWVRLTATILAHLAQNMAVVATAKSARGVFKHMELLSIQERTALLVLVLQGARVRQQLITFPQEVAQQDLSALSNHLNVAWSGLTATDIATRPEPLSETEKLVVDTILAIIRAEDSVTYEDPYVEGLQFLIGQPEFAQPSQAQVLAELLQQKGLMQAIAPQLHLPGVHVAIGQENASEATQKLSIIISRYGLPGQAIGCIAVIGPTRMPYMQGIAAVDYLSDVLTHLIAQLYGRVPAATDEDQRN